MSHEEPTGVPEEDCGAVNSRSLKLMGHRLSLSSFVWSWLDQLPSHRSTTREAMSLACLEPDAIQEPCSNTQGCIGSNIQLTPIRSLRSGTEYTTPSRRTHITNRDPIISKSTYRQDHLEPNNIIFLPFRVPLPDHVAKLCSGIENARKSPEPPSHEVQKETGILDDLQCGGSNQNTIHEYLLETFFPYKEAREKNLKKDGKTEFFRRFVPDSSSSPAKVATPRPDMVYGYDAGSQGPFSEAQRLSVGGWTEASTVNNLGLAFPFFIIELKAGGHVNGNIWVATNQCLGGFTTCVNVVHRLNQLLAKYPGSKIMEDTSFSIAMDQRTATIYVSWRGEELKYFTREVDTFLLKHPTQFLRFRKIVKNILDWGAEKRLEEIRAALDYIIEEDRKAVSLAAKARSQPEAYEGLDEAPKPPRCMKQQ